MIYLGQTYSKDDRVYIMSVRKIEDNEFYDESKFVTISKEVYEHCLEILYESSKKAKSPFVIYLDMALVNDGTKMIMALDEVSEMNTSEVEKLPYVNTVSAIIVDESAIDSDNSESSPTDTGYDDTMMNVMNYANIAISNAENIIYTRSRMYPHKLFTFNKYNIMLNARGYFITDENRDEKYIEIIESSDEVLIDIFLNYIDAYDFLSMENNMMEIFSDFKDKVKEAKSKEEIDKMYFKFFSDYL